MADLNPDDADQLGSFYLGVEPAHLVRYYSVDDGTPASIAVSRPSKLFACTATHLFSSPQAPEDPYSTTTYRVLSAVADRAPFKSGVLYCCEMSRFLLGEQLAERLSLPRGGWVNCLKVQRTCLGMGVFVYFGRYYRRGWEMERVVLCRKLMTMIVACAAVLTFFTFNSGLTSRPQMATGRTPHPLHGQSDPDSDGRHARRRSRSRRARPGRPDGTRGGQGRHPQVEVARSGDGGRLRWRRGRWCSGGGQREQEVLLVVGGKRTLAKLKVTSQCMSLKNQVQKIRASDS